MADPRLQTGGCLIESQMGSIELSVDAQLAEIERGFFDLLHQRLSVRQDALSCSNCGMEAIQ
jgi:flagellar biosynthesis/type III secretory pathway protein FliH